MFTLQVTNQNTFRFQRLNNERMTFNNHLFRFKSLRSTPSRQVNYRQTSALHVNPIRGNPWYLRVRFAHITTATPLLGGRVRSPSVARISIKGRPLVRLPIVTSRRILHLLVNLKVTSVSHHIRFHSAINRVNIRLSLFKNVRGNILRLIRHPISALCFRAFSSLTNTGLMLHRRHVINFTLFVLNLLLNSFRITRSSRLLANLIPVYKVNMRVRHSMFTPLIFNSARPSNMASITINFIIAAKGSSKVYRSVYVHIGGGVVTPPALHCRL